MQYHVSALGRVAVTNGRPANYATWPMPLPGHITAKLQGPSPLRAVSAHDDGLAVAVSISMKQGRHATNNPEANLRPALMPRERRKRMRELRRYSLTHPDAPIGCAGATAQQGPGQTVKHPRTL